MLTGKEIVEKGIITGEIEKDNVQQHGVDLNLIKVSRLIGAGYIPPIGKTKLCNQSEIESEYDPIYDAIVWHLSPGAYDITFAQGCSIPSDQRMKIIHRSSLFRNGGQLNSALFDAGFSTDNIGTVMILTNPMVIALNARIGQAFVDQSNAVENLYNGQWQNDKQRNEVKV